MSFDTRRSAMAAESLVAEVSGASSYVDECSPGCDAWATDESSAGCDVCLIADGSVASTVPTSLAMLDPKILGKPGIFGGDEGTWMEWSFSVRSYLHLTGWVNDVVLTRAETRREPILLEEVPETKRSSTDILVSLCRGR